MKLEELSDLLEEYSKATRMPISCFQGDELLMQTMSRLSNYNLPMLLMQCLPKSLPASWYCISPEHMYMGGLHFSDRNLTLFLGPSMVFSCSVQQASEIIEHIGLRRKELSGLMQYFNALGTCDAASLQAGLGLLQRLLNQEHTAPQQVEFRWSKISRFLPVSVEEDTEEGVGELEKLIVDYIRNGKSEELEEIIQKDILIDAQVTNQEQSFRQQRIYITNANFFCSRIAMSAGVDSTLISRLYAMYFRQIQTATSDGLTYIFASLIREYTRQVALVRKFHGETLLAERVNRYIGGHLYEKITPTILSEKLNINLSYLCRQFKTATGKTISYFIQERKIEEAKYLLKQNALSVSTISQMLDFSSVSYFDTVFKKHTGFTPAEYRLNDTV